MNSKRHIYEQDSFSVRSSKMKPFFHEFYLFNEDIPGSHTTGLNGEYVGNDKTPFVDNPDYMCIGCSFTSGEGLPELYSWPSLIRLFTGKTVNNCSMRGAGPTWLTAASFDLMKKHGAPKSVFALFPDMERALVHKWTEGNLDENSKTIAEASHAYWDGFVGAFTYRPNFETTKILELKDFQGKKYLVSLESIIFQSFMMLDTLDSHFELSNIPFKFSFWPPHTHKSFVELKNEYSSFLDTKYWEENIETSTKYRDEWLRIDSSTSEMARGLWRKFGNPSNSDRLCSHEPQTKSQFKFWNIAADNHHPGLHDQIHLAEHFLGTEMNNNFIMDLP